MYRVFGIGLCLLTGCFSSHEVGSRDAGPDARPVPACWPAETEPGIYPCGHAEGAPDPCQCDNDTSNGCWIYSVSSGLLRGRRGSCFTWEDVAWRDSAPFDPCLHPYTCEHGRVCDIWNRDVGVTEADNVVAREHVFPRCVDPRLCVRLRDSIGVSRANYCMFSDLSLATTGVIPAPSCAERPMGLLLCGAGCECGDGYECGAYSEDHPWAPCYPTGALVPSMPFDGAWMTRLATPEEAARVGGRVVWERHYVDPSYCDAVAAAFPGRYACASLPDPEP